MSQGVLFQCAQMMYVCMQTLCHGQKLHGNINRQPSYARHSRLLVATINTTTRLLLIYQTVDQYLSALTTISTNTRLFLLQVTSKHDDEMDIDRQPSYSRHSVQPLPHAMDHGFDDATSMRSVKSRDLEADEPSAMEIDDLRSDLPPSRGGRHMKANSQVRT